MVSVEEFVDLAFESNRNDVPSQNYNNCYSNVVYEF